MIMNWMNISKKKKKVSRMDVNELVTKIMSDYSSKDNIRLLSILSHIYYKIRPICITH